MQDEMTETHADEAICQPAPAQLVKNYLEAMESRKIEQASGMLAPDFEMIFPGNTAMTSLDALIAWAAERYRFVRKSYDAFETFQNNGADIVYVRGTLSGAWLDGAVFAGIRFIDRFEISSGKITRQEVWNDIAEGRQQ